MPLEGFEPAIPGSEWRQTHILDRAASGIGQDTLVGPLDFRGWAASPIQLNKVKG